MRQLVMALLLTACVASSVSTKWTKKLPALKYSIEKPCGDVEKKLLQLSKFRIELASHDVALVNAVIEIKKEIRYIGLKVSMWNCVENQQDFSYECVLKDVWETDNACEDLSPPWNVFGECPVQPGLYRITNAPFYMDFRSEKPGVSQYRKLQVEGYQDGEKVACIGVNWRKAIHDPQRPEITY